VNTRVALAAGFTPAATLSCQNASHAPHAVIIQLIPTYSEGEQRCAAQR
jgi:hypothetical protein